MVKLKHIAGAFALAIFLLIFMQPYNSNVPLSVMGTVFPREVWLVLAGLLALVVYFIVERLSELRMPTPEKVHPYIFMRQPLNIETFKKSRTTYEGPYRVHVLDAGRDFRQKHKGERYKGAYIELHRPFLPEPHRWAFENCISYFEAVDYLRNECNTSNRKFSEAMFDDNAFEIREQHGIREEFELQVMKAQAEQGMAIPSAEPPAPQQKPFQRRY